MISQKSFSRPNHEVFLQNVSLKILNEGKIRKNDEEKVFFRKKNVFNFLKAFFIKMGCAKYAAGGWPSCLSFFPSTFIIWKGNLPIKMLKPNFFTLTSQFKASLYQCLAKWWEKWWFWKWNFSDKKINQSLWQSEPVFQKSERNGEIHSTTLWKEKVLLFPSHFLNWKKNHSLKAYNGWNYPLFDGSPWKCFVNKL